MAANLSKKSFESLDDKKLVACVQTRDAAAKLAFSVLIERYRAPLLRRCERRLRNRHDAEDALQETLLRAYRGLGGFRGEASVSTWLTAIADNQCASLAQRRARHVMGEHLRQLILLHEEVQPAYESGDDRPRRAQRTFARAPCRDREILFLRFFQDLTLEEIASTLGIGLSTAKMRLYRALARAQSRLEDPARAGVARNRGE